MSTSSTDLGNQNPVNGFIQQIEQELVAELQGLVHKTKDGEYSSWYIISQFMNRISEVSDSVKVWIAMPLSAFENIKGPGSRIIDDINAIFKADSAKKASGKVTDDMTKKLLSDLESFKNQIDGSQAGSLHSLLYGYTDPKTGKHVPGYIEKYGADNPKVKNLESTYQDCENNLNNILNTKVLGRPMSYFLDNAGNPTIVKELTEGLDEASQTHRDNPDTKDDWLDNWLTGQQSSPTATGLNDLIQNELSTIVQEDMSDLNTDGNVINSLNSAAQKGTSSLTSLFEFVSGHEIPSF